MTREAARGAVFTPVILCVPMGEKKSLAKAGTGQNQPLGDRRREARPSRTRPRFVRCMLSPRPLQQSNYSIEYLCEGGVGKVTDFGFHKRSVGRKQLARTDKAYPLQGPRREVNIGHLNRVCIRIRIAGDLTQNPVVTSSASDYNGWPKGQRRAS